METSAFYTITPSYPHQTHDQLLEVSKEQHPFAAVLGCSDSRVPPEIIFDQGLGDIFDIRVAGNVVDPIVLGSLEYAVEHLHIPLILVMGHERCGAVQATLNHKNPHNHINSIIREIAPATQDTSNDPEKASKKNVIRKYLESGQLKLVGGYYHLDSGQMELSPFPMPEKKK